MPAGRHRRLRLQLGLGPELCAYVCLYVMKSSTAFITILAIIVMSDVAGITCVGECGLIDMSDVAGITCVGECGLIVMSDVAGITCVGGVVLLSCLM